MAEHGGRPFAAWTTWAAAALLAVAGVAAWFNAFGVPFHFDDDPAIVHNASLHEFWPVWKSAWAPSNTTLAGRPVPAFTFVYDWAVHGDNVWWYHAHNLIFHVLVALALFGAVRRAMMLESMRARFGGHATWIALAAALLWLVHPLTTQSVTYIVRRVEVMMGLFFFLTLYASVRSFETGSPKWRWAAVGFAALGMATSETMVVVPFVVLLFDRAFVSPSWRDVLARNWRLYAGFAATWAIVLVILLSSPRGPEATLHAPPGARAAYLRAQAHFVPHYLALSFWPKNLTFDYGFLTPGRFAASVLETGLVLALMAATVVLVFARPRWGFLPATFFLVLAPSSSLVPVMSEIAAENRMYVPLAALVVGVAAVVFTASRRALVVAVGLAVVAALALGARTIARNADYRSELALYSDTVAKVPDNARALYNIGRCRFAGKEFDKAETCYRDALRAETHYQVARESLAELLVMLRRPKEAVDTCLEMLTMTKNGPDALEESCRVARMLAVSSEESERNGAESVRLAERLCQSAPAPNPVYLDTLAAGYARAGQWDEAIAAERKAMAAVDPGDEGTAGTLRAHRVSFEKRKALVETP